MPDICWCMGPAMAHGPFVILRLPYRIWGTRHVRLIYPTWEHPHPIADITLDLYADAILDAIGDSAIVLGHSMAGFPISRRRKRHLIGLIA